MGICFARNQPLAATSHQLSSHSRSSWGHADTVTALAFVGPSTVVSADKNSRMLMADWPSQSLIREWDWRHDRSVTRLTMDLQHRRVASAGRDAVVALSSVDPAGPSTVQVLRGHTMGVMGIAFSPDASHLASGARDGDMRLWDLTHAVCVREAHLNQNVVTSIRWVPRSSSILQSSEDKTLRVWDSRTMSVAVEFPRQQYILSCCDAADDTFVFVTGSNGFGGQGCAATVCGHVRNARSNLRLQLWDSRQPRIFLAEFRGHQESITDCVFSPDNSLVVTSSLDNTVRLWRNDYRGQCAAEYTSGFSNFTALSVSTVPTANRFRFVAGTNAGIIDVVDVDVTTAVCTRVASY